MTYTLLALGVALAIVIFWLVKSAEGKGAVKQELKQASETIKGVEDAIKKSDEIDKMLTTLSDDDITNELNKHGWMRPSNDN